MTEEEYFHVGLKSLRQTVFSYKGRNVSSVTFKSGQPKKPREVCHASVLCQYFLIVLC